MRSLRLATFALVALTTFGLSIFAVASPSPIDAPATVWHVPLSPHTQDNPRQLIVSPNGQEVFVADSLGVMARAVDDGHFIWRRQTVRAPIAISGDSLIAFTIDHHIAALDARTARRLWTSSIRGLGTASLEADSSIVIAGFEPVDKIAAEHGQAFEATVALAATDGKRLWSVHSDNGGGSRAFKLLDSLVLCSVSLWGEPDVDVVEAFDRSTGARRLSLTWARYSIADKREFWSIPTRDPDGYEAARYDRYDSRDARSLGRYTYAPEPARNSIGFGGQNRYASGQPVPTVITNSSVFIDVNDRLYRYDRDRSPVLQEPASYNVKGVLIDVIAERPLILNGNEANLLTLRDRHTYSETHLDFTPEVSTGYDHYAINNVSVQKIPGIRAKGKSITYLGRIAVTSRGEMYRIGAVCANEIPLLLSGVVALCNNSLVRMEMRALCGTR